MAAPPARVARCPGNIRGAVSPPPVQVHRGLAAPTARYAAVVEIDPADDARGTGEDDHVAAGFGLEGEVGYRCERRAVPERDPHVEHLEIAAFDYEANALEAGVPRGPEDVVVRLQIHLTGTEVNPLLLNAGRQNQAEQDGCKRPQVRARHGRS